MTSYQSTNLLALLLLVLHETSVSTCARILMTTMPQGRSHANSMLPLAKALVSGGHEVVVYMEVFQDEPPLGSGVKEHFVKIHGADFSTSNNKQFVNIIWHGEMNAVSKCLIVCYY